MCAERSKGEVLSVVSTFVKFPLTVDVAQGVAGGTLPGIIVDYAKLAAIQSPQF